MKNLKRQYRDLNDLEAHIPDLWQSDWLKQQYDNVHARFEDRLLHSATVRDEVRRGVRISDEPVEVTMYAWLQRFFDKSPRYLYLDDVTVGDYQGRIIFDLFDELTQFEPRFSEDAFWQAFKKHYPAYNDYSAWSFGSAPDKLATLVKNGVKTATSSAYPLYQLEGEALPKAGDINIIRYQNGDICCATKTLDVSTMPFNQVPRMHAYYEGEGDRSLRYWQIAHHVFFNRELKAHELEFSEDIQVVCERFVKLADCLSISDLTW